jgi:hypothetical protein
MNVKVPRASSAASMQQRKLRIDIDEMFRNEERRIHNIASNVGFRAARRCCVLISSVQLDRLTEGFLSEIYPSMIGLSHSRTQG